MRGRGVQAPQAISSRPRLQAGVGSRERRVASLAVRALAVTATLPRRREIVPSARPEPPFRSGSKCRSFPTRAVHADHPTRPLGGGGWG